jgi:hypothetical protein
VAAPSVPRPAARPATGKPPTGQSPRVPEGGARTRTPGVGSGPLPAPPAAVDEGAGFLLALLLWGWVGLPFLQGGPGRVRDVLRAKFFNRGADGKWLP